MNIAIITCHNVYNYGASLQCYALSHYLEEQGHQVRVIDYRPDLKGYSLVDEIFEIHHPLWNTNILRKGIYWATHVPFRVIEKIENVLNPCTKRNKFDSFTKRCLKITQKRYFSCDDLTGCQDLSDVDIFIAGSDQIWNTYDKKGRDPAFYLQFAPCSSKRISYAASIASETLNPEYREKVVQMLKEMDSISIREHDSVELLEKCGISDVVPVCDPVFLHDKDFWEKFGAENSSFLDSCILVYDSDKSSVVSAIAQSLRKQTGLPIVSIGPHRYSYAQKNFMNLDPSEFVGAIMKAEYVVTNSFHALAFSIIFNKKIWIVPRMEDRNVRLESLLNFLDLEHRLIITHDDTDDLLIDMNFLKSKIDTLIVSSKSFLEEELR